MTNTLKHGGPSVTAAVQLRYLPKDVEIDVTDNGHPTGVARSGPVIANGGHGLTGMRERLAAVGGGLSVGRRPEGGVAVEAWIPLGVPS